MIISTKPFDLKDLTKGSAVGKGLSTDIPLKYQGLWYWFDGTNSNSYIYDTAPKVGIMGDVSNNGNTFNRVDPLYEGVKSGNSLLLTDTTNNERYERYMPIELTLPFNKNFSIYTVFACGDTGVSTSCEILQTRSGGANVITLLRQAGGNFKVGVTGMSGVGTNVTTNTVEFNKTTIVCSRHDNGASGSGTACINGVEGVSWVGNMNTSSGVWSNASKLPARIHQGNNSGTNFYLYEMLIFTRKTTDTEHTDLINYLAAKWDIVKSVTNNSNAVTNNTNAVTNT